MTAPTTPKLERTMTIPQAAALAGVHRTSMARRLLAADKLAGGGLLFRMSPRGPWCLTRSTLARHLPGLLPKRGLNEDEAAAILDRILDLEAAKRADAKRLREHSTSIAALQREIADFRAKSHAWLASARDAT